MPVALAHIILEFCVSVGQHHFWCRDEYAFSKKACFQADSLLFQHLDEKTLQENKVFQGTKSQRETVRYPYGQIEDCFYEEQD
jgi:hypothetical protein